MDVRASCNGVLSAQITQAVLREGLLRRQIARLAVATGRSQLGGLYTLMKLIGLIIAGQFPCPLSDRLSGAVRHPVKEGQNRPCRSAPCISLISAYSPKTCYESGPDIGDEPGLLLRQCPVSAPIPCPMPDKYRCAAGRRRGTAEHKIRLYVLLHLTHLACPFCVSFRACRRPTAAEGREAVGLVRLLNRGSSVVRTCKSPA